MPSAEDARPPGAAAPGTPGPATRRAARNALAVSAAQVAGKVATLAYTIAAARVLGERDFGTFAYALSFALLASTLPSWGFDALLVQRGSRDPGALRRLLSETLVWRTAISVPVFAGAAIAAILLRPDAESATVFLLVLAATAVETYADAGHAAAAALQDQTRTSASLVVQRFVTALLAVGALALDLGLVGLAVSYLIGSLVGAAGVAAAVRRLGVGTDLRGIRREGLVSTAKMSIAIGIDAVISLALFRIDQVMLGLLRGDEDVGVYAAAYRLLETILFVAWAVAKAVFPVMSATTEPWRIRRGVEQGLAATALLYIPFGVGLLVEAAPVLTLLYGPGFAEGGTAAARWLAPAPILFAAAYLGSYALLATERRWQVVWTSLLALVVNVGLNLALIPILGSTGAAITTTASYLVEAVVVLSLLAPSIGLPSLTRVLGPAALAAGAMGALLAALGAGLAIEVPVGVAVYLGIWYPLARWWTPEHLAVIGSLVPGRRRATPEAPEPR